jgi:hypothetical protein
MGYSVVLYINLFLNLSKIDINYLDIKNHYGVQSFVCVQSDY